MTEKPVEGQGKPAAADSEHKLKAGNEEAARQIADYKESLQRLQAEFENYKKRVERETAQFRQYAAADVIKSLLPVLDSFELAIKAISHGKAAATGDSERKLCEGFELIYGQFYSVLEAQGLRPIKAVGGKLDPYRHEVLLNEATGDEKKDGMVVEEFQKGYTFNDVVLRYSKVKVLKFLVNDN